MAEPMNDERPFGAYGQFGPGEMDLRAFDQEQVWVDILGVPHALHEMSIAHRSNLISHLLKFASHYRLGIARRDLIDTSAELVDRGAAPEIQDKPARSREWVESTSLMRRLRSTTPWWETHVTDERDRLSDDDTGRWWVITEGSAYLVDLDAHNASRAPGLGGDGLTVDLRRDGEPVPLLGIGECRRARSAVFVLDIRGGGVPTIRTTSLVARITTASDDLTETPYL
ncbi:hypothetical protein [Georgenia yuyongxinii]|uniref:Uncharacterized protein n=1 Tax=Georgenia yuyongxinii TaxID=2589797 RepID=A0A552WPH9_9MICO|nr:hypothetical protein [Georgenia yuyongxinii]TRW44403.1 hypothetical protein FJ693_13820 [Georgenia yuyongxinii]